jgi:phosphotransferase system  glucose/maltose/N-acetylglucosamine-specific IIC component
VCGCVSDNTSYLKWCLCGGYYVVFMAVSVYRRCIEANLQCYLTFFNNCMVRVPMTVFPILVFFILLIILWKL